MSILVGYVPTPVGEVAADAAIYEATLRQEELLIVNSKREGVVVDKTVASDAELSNVLNKAQAAGVKATLLQSTHSDDLADEILDLAEKHDVSLIVIGLRHRTQVGTFIMGSLAQRILLQAERPVLAVKAPGQ